jgi:hypothetical protein
MNSVGEILDAIRALPRPDRLRLAEALAAEFESEPNAGALPAPPAGSNLEVRSGFYVYTGPVRDPSVLDHRVVREERIDHLTNRASARRD